MARPDEDQPNRDLPVTQALPPTTQHWRVQVPKPATSLQLGQRVPASATEPPDGYPGVTVRTQAGFFADVRERTVWQGHDVIAFQSLFSAELHAGHALVLGSTRWTAKDLDPAAGAAVGRTKAQNVLYGQLREQSLWMDSLALAWNAFGVAKSLITFEFGKSSVPKLLGLAGKTWAVGSEIGSIASTAAGDIEPAAGVHVTSSEGLFLGAGGATTVFGRGGITLMAGGPSSINGYAPIGVSFTAGLTAELFAMGIASLSAGYSASATGLYNAGLVAKLGTASVLGPTVHIGAQVPGKENLSEKFRLNPLFLRPTSNIVLSALESVTTEVVGKFVVNAPLGEVKTQSRVVDVDAVQTVTLKTPLGKIEISATGIALNHTMADVKITPDAVRITCGVSKVTVGLAGITLSSPGATVNLLPGGVVRVSGALVKLG